MILEKEQIQRYLRHILIPEISGPGQKKLLDSSVFVRCHSLTNSAFMLYYLAAMGIGEIHCTAGDMKDKAFIENHIKSLNPHVKLIISTIEEDVQSYVAKDYAAAIVFSERYDVSIMKPSMAIPAICIASADASGYLRTLQNGASIYSIEEEIYRFYKDMNGRNAYSLFNKACCGLLGALAAIEAVKAILDVGTLCSKPLKFDLASNSFVYDESLTAAVPLELDYSMINQRLKGSKALIVGSGGLGSPAAYMLTAMGVGTIGLVDFDAVELSNLNRQILHTTDKIGMAKVKSAEIFLKELNPRVQIFTYEQKLAKDNAELLIKDYDIIIDGLDNLAARYLLNDVCCFLNKPMIEAGVLGFNGLITAIEHGSGPCYRCIFPESMDKNPVPS